MLWRWSTQGVQWIRRRKSSLQFFYLPASMHIACAGSSRRHCEPARDVGSMISHQCRLQVPFAIFPTGRSSESTSSLACYSRILSIIGTTGPWKPTSPVISSSAGSPTPPRTSGAAQSVRGQVLTVI